MSIHQSRTYTFIVRVWPEENDPGQAVWRGTLVCVQTGERASFQTLGGLAEKVTYIVERDALHAYEHSQGGDP